MMETGREIIVTSDEIEELAESLFLKQQERGIPEKILLKPEEAAYVLGFTDSAFNQAEWTKELPVVKIGIKNYYLPADLRTWAENRRITRIRKPPRKLRVA
jgi:hypothetical protein